MKNPRIAVVGAGPVGSIVTAYLTNGGHEITVIEVLQQIADKLRTAGLRIGGYTEMRVQIARTYSTLKAAAADGARFDAIFVCVKGPVNELIAPDLPAALAEDGVAISFQNGLDTEAPILAACGPERTLRGAVNYAGNALGPADIRMTFFNGANFLGAAAKGNAVAERKAKELAELLSGATMATEFTEDVHRHVWAKAIRNAALMPISALTGLDMAEVMEFQPSLAFLEQLLKEEIAVAASAGYAFDQKFYDDSLAYFRKAGHHMPSMYADMLGGSRSEIGFLNVRIAEIGERNGVPVVYNRAIATLVQCVDEVARLHGKTRS
jgi:2-dehydropantoate 2-reductase